MHFHNERAFSSGAVALICAALMLLLAITAGFNQATNRPHYPIPGVKSSQVDTSGSASAYVPCLMVGAVGFIAFIVWLNTPSKKRLGKVGPTKYFSGAVAIAGPGDFEWDVVGESNYQAALHKICGGKRSEGVEFETRAMLVFEHDNPKNPNAVAVYIDGLQVGYLPDEDADSFRDAVNAADLRSRFYSVAAMIVGGWDRGGGNEGMFGVKLDLPVEDAEFELKATAN